MRALNKTAPNGADKQTHRPTRPSGAELVKTHRSQWTMSLVIVAAPRISGQRHSREVLAWRPCWIRSYLHPQSPLKVMPTAGTGSTRSGPGSAISQSSACLSLCRGSTRRSGAKPMGRCSGGCRERRAGSWTGASSGSKSSRNSSSGPLGDMVVEGGEMWPRGSTA